MAVGRRKRFASSQTSLTSVVTVFTAGTAPADGSAAASVTALTLNNVGAGASTVTVYAPGSIVIWQVVLTAQGSAGSAAVVPFTIDLMGGEPLSIQQSVAQALHYSAYGVEAKDS